MSLKRQVVMVQLLSINFFSWISSIFVGFFKSSRFFVSLCTWKPQDDVYEISASFSYLIYLCHSDINCM